MIRPGILSNLANWLNEIEELLNESNDLIEFQGKLSEIYPKLDISKLSSQLTQALILAN